MRQEEWMGHASAHADRTRPWVAARLARRAVGHGHPVDDFLFDYYPFSPGKLATWHPGHGVVLEGSADAFLAHPAYVRTSDGVTTTLSWLTDARLARLDVATRILTGIGGREPMTGCFALHEWAMVYGLEQDEVRHASLPLRLAPADIRATVDATGLRCTHIDAYRFFTAEAVPLNSLVPTRATQPDLDQPGCLHASMDLYKYAFWFSPLVASELIADCFELARAGRALDMRASPYDVSPFGLDAIRVETPEGRREYQREQSLLMEQSAPLRRRLLAALADLASAVSRP